MREPINFPIPQMGTREDPAVDIVVTAHHMAWGIDVILDTTLGHIKWGSVGRSAGVVGAAVVRGGRPLVMLRSDLVRVRCCFFLITRLMIRVAVRVVLFKRL